jgi:Uma2 family endonuclease
MNVPQRPYVASPTAQVRWTVDAYAKMHKAGLFDGWSGAELREGVLYRLNSQQLPHVTVKSELAFALKTALVSANSGLNCLIEPTTVLNENTLLEPDLGLDRLPAGDGYLPCANLLLAVEVADSSLRFDLGKKLKYYAKAGVAEYWVADVKNRRIELFWRPLGDSYAQRATIPFGEPVAVQTLADITVATGNL